VKTNLRKALVALVVAAGAAGIGVGLASAQTDSPTTTSPPSTSAPQEQDRKEHCPHDGSRREPGTPGDSGTEGSAMHQGVVRRA
jgi:hypothetical protein